MDIIDSLILSKSNRKQIKKEKTKNVTRVNVVQMIKKDKEKDTEQKKDNYKQKKEKNKLIEPKEQFTYKQKEEDANIYIYKRTR